MITKKAIPIDTRATKIINKKVKTNEYHVSCYQTFFSDVKRTFNIPIRQLGHCYCGSKLIPVLVEKLGIKRWYKLCSKTRHTIYNCIKS